MKNMTRFGSVALVLCILLALVSMFGLGSFAQETSNKDREITLIEKKEVAAPELSYHSLRYYGGFVTRVFGIFESYTYDKPLYEDKEGTNVILKADSPSPLYEVTIVLCCLVAYILGSINFATIISGKKYKDDVRKHGSGNAGMTNMLRTYGKKAALWTLLGDIGKAVVAVLVGILLVGDPGGYFAGIFCIFGHAFPIFYGFKGGKGVACTAGVVLMLEPLVFLFMFIVFAGVFLMTKYISLASIMAMMFYPVLLSRFYAVGHQDMLGASQALPIHVSIISILMACFVIFLHRGNIKRLYHREERKTELFKKKKKENQEKI